MAAVAELVACNLGADGFNYAPRDGSPPQSLVAEVAKHAPSGGWVNPGLVGLVHEQAASSDERRRRGAWYTPRAVVQGLIGMATSDGWQPSLVIDPTCGGGAFLLAALDHLFAQGLTPHDCVARIRGMDIDHTAVAVSSWSVRLWLLSKGADPDVEVSVVHGNALEQTVPGLADASEPVLIAGNPPFASPLKTGVTRSQSCVLGPYADTAAEHLMRAINTVPNGSRVVLVQPQSVLSGRDTRAMRAHIDGMAPLHALWVAREPVFDAGVRACAPLLVVGECQPDMVRLAAGPMVEPAGERPAQDWGVMGAAALGAPALPVAMLAPNDIASPTLGSMVSCTAGFRDEHYGLVAACAESGLKPDLEDRLVTVGAVDPLTCWWGLRPIRFGGRKWERPVIDPGQLNAKVRGWFERQHQPKVLLATQSKVLEPVIDRDGNLVPSTPLIAVHCDPKDIDLIAAVLLAPPVVLWAWGRWFGTALASDAIKLAARQVGELPLPADNEAWAQAAAIVAKTDPAEPDQAWDQTRLVAEIMTRAYQASSEVFDWWLQRTKPYPAHSSNQ